MEISDLETEKSVLENQNIKLNTKIKNLTDSNDNLNLTNINLNKKLAKASSEEIKRNKTYETLLDITKEGVSLKTTFSAIAKGIETINLNSEAKLVESSSRESEENISILKDKLELIKSLMEQISSNLDLTNQNKESAWNIINITNHLGQQIINNTNLLIESKSYKRKSGIK